MLVDGIQYIEGSTTTNLVLPNVTAEGIKNLALPNAGEVVYQTSGDFGMYVYTGTTWARVKTSEDVTTVTVKDIPPFIGDVISPSGSNVLTLASISTAGTYTKVSIDEKGRVISGSKPTTIDGLGVNDVYTKAYIDNKFATLKAVMSINGKAGEILKIEPADIVGLAPSATIDATNASNLSSGNVPVARLPLYSGDVTSSASAATLTLATVLTTPGTFNKLSANNKGLVISGSLEKTLAGLGLIDAVNIKMLPVTGNAKTTQIVKGNDTRLFDKRDPNPHQHLTSDIISLNVPIDAAVSSAVNILNNTISTMNGSIQTALGTKENTANRNVPNGYAGLGSDGKVDSSHLPAIIVNNVYTATTLEERNALPALKSDIAVVAGDIGKSFILRQLPPSVDANWVEMQHPIVKVSTVNGKSGVVTLSFDDIPGLLRVDSMPDTGIAAGNYTAVTVDAKGRVTAGTPEIPANQIDPSTIPYTKAEVDYKFTGKVDKSTAGRPLGYVALDANGKCDQSILQGILLNPRHVVDTLEDRLGLQADVGDAAIVLGGINKTFVLTKLPPSGENNWVEIISTSATKVLSINGKDGTVVLSYTDINGVLPIASVPAFGGDVISAEGTTTLNLKNVATPGTYSRVTVNAKGLVVSGEAIDTSATASAIDAGSITTGTLNSARLSTNVVLTNDERLTDSRLPLPHTTSLITDFTQAVSGAITTALATPGSVQFPVNSVNGKTGTVVLTKTEFDLGNVNNTSDASKPVSAAQQAAIDLKESLSNKNVTGGYVGINSSGKIDSKYLPSMSIGSRYTVTDLAARNALTASVGDIAIVAGTVNKTYMLNASPATTDANWIELLSPTGGVTSINGSSGVVVLDLTNIVGTLPVTKLPAFTGGDVVAAEHTGTLTLTNTGVSPGTYSSVTVDAKGRVTNGTNTVSNSGGSTNASDLTSGQLSVARLPAFTGDITAAAGTANLVLNTSGVTPGTYTSVTVDSKGRVTNGTNPSTAGITAVTSAFTSSTLNASSLPAFMGGDVTSNGGTSTLILSNSGVVEGTYNTVTVDKKGRVTTGTNIPMYPSSTVDTKLDGKVDKTSINVPGGIVGLSGTSKINQVYLPAMTINNRFTVTTLEGRNALTANVGDIAIVAGTIKKSYILNATPASTPSNWLELLNPTGGVLSFNGQVGDVTFSANDMQGEIPSTSLPAFTGDVTSTSGTNVITLKPSGVVAGTYNKITVNDKGQVINGQNVNWIEDASNITKGVLDDNRLSTNIVKTSDPRLTDSRNPLPHQASLITDFTQAVQSLIQSTPTTSSSGGAVSSVNTKIGAVVLTKTDVGLGNVDNTTDATKPISLAVAAALELKEVKTNKNIPGGFVGLNDVGKIDTSRLPAMTINNRYAVNTLAQRNSLAAGVGDIAIVAGTTNKTFILNATPATDSNNWMEMLNPTGGVVTINNMSGDVSLTLTNIDGILPSTKLPALAGDVTSVSGTNVITLANTGVTAGTYNSVTVDRKGRVIAGSTAPASIDLSNTEINANNLTQGTIPVGRLPAFNGDVTTAAGTNTVTLANSGVTPGTYTSVTVDAKGRVIAGTVATSTMSNASNLLTGTLPDGRLPAFSGDIISAAGSSTLTLTNTGVLANTYNSVTVDEKGRVTSGIQIPIYNAVEIDSKLLNKLDYTTANSPSGFAQLDENGKVSPAVLPSLSINNKFVVTTLAQRNALTASIGDFVIVAGTVNKSFILQTLPASNDSNWLEILNPSGGVTALNGETGVVSLTLDNITGTLTSDKLPVFTGDVVSVGSVITLNTTGVSPGSYNKVTVNSKGLITSATNATTLAGLGITDAVSTSMLPTGSATSSQLVLGDDPRLTNSREPTAHTHVSADITDLQTVLDTAKGSVIDTLRSNVPSAGNNLNKLYDLIVTGINEVIVANIAERDALNIPNTKTQVFVENDGDGDWALYKATSTGVGATFVKLSDPNIINSIVGTSAESTANKDADGTLTSNSDIKYPTQKAVKTYVDQKILNTVSPNALSTLLSEKADLSVMYGALDAKAEKSYVLEAFTDVISKSRLPAPNANATSSQIVLGSDTRLTDSRSPLPHTTDSITNFNAAVSSLVSSALTSALQSYSGGVRTVNGQSGNITLTKSSVGLANVDNTADIDKPISNAVELALAGKESTSNRNTAGGYVGLNSQGKIDSLYLPSIALNNRFVRETLEERNALAASVGDVAIITGSINKTYILNALPASADSSWIELASPLGTVSSVNGLTGTISLTLSDISGVLPASKLPAFIGDAKSTAGSNTLTLSNTGVTAGTYNSVTVDSKGRVTSASTVDNTTYNASVLNTGTLSTDVLPAFDGDDIGSVAGSNVLYLKPTGVVAGTYNKVTVNSKGRITSATNIPVGTTDASELITGTLSAERLPAFTGDVVSLSGTNTTTLTYTGVIAGTYNSVTVDRKGRVTAGTSTPSYSAAQIDTKLSEKLDVSRANQASGYVSLNSSLKIDQAYLPAITLNNRFVATTLAERNAFLAKPGDVAIVAGDVNKTYILNALPATIDDNWIELKNPLETVTSFNGRTGVVTINIPDLTGTLNISSLPAFTGDVNSVDGSNTLTLKNSGVTAGLYNVVTVNAKGIITSATNASTLAGVGITDAYTKTEIGDLLQPKLTSDSNLNASKLNTGYIPDVVLSDIVDSGQYQSVSIDTKGRVIGGIKSTNTALAGQIFIAANSTQGAWASMPSSTNASSLTTGTLNSTLLSDSGVTAGSYGSVQVDSKGRVVSGVLAVNTSSAGQIFVANNEYTGTWTNIPSSSDASALTTGTLNANLLPTSGVNVGKYAVVDVDVKGRVVSGMLSTNTASSGQILIANGSGSATWSSIPIQTNASNLTTGTLSTSLLPTSGVSYGDYGSATQVGTFSVDAKGRITSASNATITPAWNNITSKPTTLSGFGITDAVNTSALGLANGVATLGSDGKVPATQLPSYVDDVLEYSSLASLPASGELGKIYIAQDSGKIYRWTGSAYIEINSSVGTADVAVKLTHPRTIAATGDATWSVSFDGSSDVSSALTLSNTGVSPGVTGGSSATPIITVDSKGRITAISTTAITPAWSNITGLPTTLAGFGITDAQPLNSKLTSLSGLSTSQTGLVKFTNGTASYDTNTYLTGNQSITVSGDATGSGTTSISLTLANSGVTAGTYNNAATSITPIMVDAKGRITGTGSNLTITPAWSSITSKPTTLSGFGITDAVNSSLLGASNGVATLGNDGKVPATQLPSYVDDVVEYATSASFPATGETGKIYLAIDSTKIYRWSGSQYIEISASVGAADVATKLLNARTIQVTGDASWVVSFDGSSNVAGGLTLANSGVTANTYGSATQSSQITVDAKGRITAASNTTVTPAWSSITSKPTTLTGFGITDAQPLNANLTSLSALSTSLTGIVKLTNGVASFDTNAYLTNNQTITVSGDATGSGTTSISLTLANSGVSAGSYVGVSVDAKGRTISGVASSNTPSAGNVFIATSSSAGSWGTYTVTKSDVGLGNVDNTSDANKPVSTAQQSALDAKAPKASPSFTGNVTATGTISDSLGNVRALPQNLQSSAYTLTAADSGKHVCIATGGVTIPANVFNVGDNIVLYNDSSTNQTITCSAVTAYVSGTNAIKTSIILAPRGVATIMCYRSNEVVLSGDVT